MDKEDTRKRTVKRQPKKPRKKTRDMPPPDIKRVGDKFVVVFDTDDEK
jgi:hypothetical protein